MKNFLTYIQDDSVAVVDTLTRSYSQKWEGASGLEDAGPLIKAAASHDLIFIVLGVSLIIWFVLLFFIIRLDKKVTKLESEVTEQPTEESHEA